ncbi:hypothetical protein BGW36DRAFT_463570 [Talaromyces proteolyticus]|uniref:Uncharacterized protein n=1 Tax=Talaromyces proteolyticus TaxID=1131652 RepID=A0AAD4KLG3_9EURO|nr:uncharacterized protein BGW36DRAFT_463570 [Talaromyces proteolyticus]KAH8693949.1 hypothetical protein BGW36DRAFT_463570 [Talaromyces proteolyticus]
MQQIAAIVIPELDPHTCQIGKAKNAQRRMLDFSVTEFLKVDNLHDVRQQMSTEEQSYVVADLVKALGRIHSVRLSDKWVKEILDKTLHEEGEKSLKSFEQPGVIGGPNTGFLSGG